MGVVICDIGSIDGMRYQLREFTESDGRVQFYSVPTEGFPVGCN